MEEEKKIIYTYVDPEVMDNLQTIRDLFYKMSNGNSQLELEFEESFAFIKDWILEAMDTMQNN